jgi:hypothetical protein
MGDQTDASSGPSAVRRLTGVYHAEGSLAGELRYLVGSLSGRAHCSLCDITHGRLRAKRGWQEHRDSLPVPFDTVHLDERSPEVAQLTEGRTPAVVAHTDRAVMVLLGPDELERCGGDPRRLVEAVRRAVTDHDLTFDG